MWFYNLGIFLYGCAIRIAALFNKKARLWINGRKNIFARLTESIPADTKLIWIHSASLGEFEQGRPVIEAIRREQPDYKILLTFFSPSGYEVRKNYEGADYIFYLPLDTPANARRFIDTVKPTIAIFIKYEFWINYLKELGRSSCRTYIVSAIFRKDSVFFRPYGGIFRKCLGAFDHIFVQNEESGHLLGQIGYPDTTVAGDTRFDRVAQITANPKELPVIEKFTSGKNVMVCGSTWPEDEQLIRGLPDSHPDLLLVIAPHETEPEKLSRFHDYFPGLKFYTECNADTDFSATRILVLDTIGFLSSAYRYARFCYIGGGFGHGIHNTLEAAAYGRPLAFGPNYRKFQEARDLIEDGAAVPVSTFEELSLWVGNFVENPEAYEVSSRAAFSYVSSHTGATSLIMEKIFPTVGR